MKTYKQWLRAGRTVRAGEKARAYLMDDDRLHGSALFAEEQTILDSGEDEQDTWTVIVAPQEYQKIRAEARKLAARPKIRVDRAHAGGVSVWCGPNKQAIGWLKDAGYRFSPTSHRWTHRDKDAERVAAGFEAMPGYLIIREWDDAHPPTPEGI